MPLVSPCAANLYMEKNNCTLCNIFTPYTYSRCDSGDDDDDDDGFVTQKIKSQIWRRPPFISLCCIVCTYRRTNQPINSACAGFNSFFWISCNFLILHFREIFCAVKSIRVFCCENRIKNDQNFPFIEFSFVFLVIDCRPELHIVCLTNGRVWHR